MPQNKFALARYSLIDKCLQEQSYVKSAYIVQYCTRKLGYSISQRMIQLDIEAMKHDSFLGFFAPIEYCKSQKAYYYASNYKICATNFSSQEIQLLNDLSIYLKNKIEEENYQLFLDLVEKITKISFVNNGEIKFRHCYLNLYKNT